MPLSSIQDTESLKPPTLAKALHFVRYDQKSEGGPIKQGISPIVSNQPDWPASKTNWGQSEDRGYGKEAIYSSSNKDYEFGEEKTQIWLGELRTYVDQTNGGCKKTN